MLKFSLLIGIPVAEVNLILFFGDKKMKSLNLNIPICIFSVGAILFLLAPLGLFSSFNASDIYTTGLFTESIGIAIGFVTIVRYKLTEKIMKEI